jgi:hypothetical protein
VDCRRHPITLETRGAPRTTAGRDLQRQGRSAYWAGKGLLRTMQLAERFEQQGDLARRDRLFDMTKKRMEEWLDGDRSR